MAKKVALLIGVGEYVEGLKSLRCPANGVAAMQDVLSNPEIGGFDEIVPLTNPDVGQMRSRMGEVFAGLTKEDLVLFYFTGHGIKDMNGKFYLSTRQTQMLVSGRVNPGTAVEADFLRSVVGDCYAARKVVILDCCFAAAFADGFMGMDDSSVDVEDQIGAKDSDSRGWCVMTASTSMQYALEQEDEDLSVYTRYLVAGLKTGGAAPDGREHISVGHWHAYVKAQVQQAAPAMEPAIFNAQQGAEIAIAKALVDNAQRYRKQVQGKVRQGRIRPAARVYLSQWQQRLKLSVEEATAIEAEVLKPFRERQKHVEIYANALKAEKEDAYPLDEEAMQDLKDLQWLLNLRDEDVLSVDKEVLPSESKSQKENEKSPVFKSIPVEPPATVSSEEKLDRHQLDALWQEIVSKLQPLGTPALMAQQANLFSFDGTTAKIALRSKPLAKMALQYIPSLEIAFFEVLNRRCKIILESQEYFSPKEGDRMRNTFDFEITLVNQQGTVVEMFPSEVEYFTESLGKNISLDMVRIPDGEFLMGATQEEEGALPREYPQHEVAVSEFWIGKYPITQVQWNAVAALQKVKRDLTVDPSNVKGVNLPVEQISWLDAVEFCQRLSQHLGREFALPSEAQWEYACRAGTKTPFSFGPSLTSALANYDGTQIYAQAPKGVYRRKTTEVGRFSPNAFGLYDMHGNVLEWCTDDWHDSYKGARSNDSAWNSFVGSEKVLRGGSWRYYSRYCRSAYRAHKPPDSVSSLVGFRVICPVFRR